MYTNVHMNYVIPITDLRKDIFAIFDRVAKTGDVVDVEKEGKRVVRIIPVKHDAAGKAEYILAHVLPFLKGVWKNEKLEKRDVAGKNYWNRAVFS